MRKDVAGYDLRSLIVGSEGTLAIVTAAWLKLVPAPELVLPVVAFYPDVRAGCAALATVMGSGLQPAALEYLDEPAVAASIRAFPGDAPEGPAFMLIAEADGSAQEATRLQRELLEALEPGALGTYAPSERGRDPGAVAVARRRGPRGDHGARRQGLRGHRRPARAPRRRDPRHA